MKLILRHIENNDCIMFAKPQKEFWTKLSKILNACDKKNGYVLVDIQKPKRPRTTGYKSQNNLVWKLITIIAQETGNDIKDVEAGIKELAVARGYPLVENKISGKMHPASMSTIDTIQCGALIETAYQVIAELGIILPPEEDTLENKTNDIQTLANMALSDNSKDIF